MNVGDIGTIYRPKLYVYMYESPRASAKIIARLNHGDKVEITDCCLNKMDDLFLGVCSNGLYGYVCRNFVTRTENNTMDSNWLELFVAYLNALANTAHDITEILADVEHQRWTHWQSYLHSQCIKNEDGSLTIPKEKVELWEYEMATPYAELPEHTKESDRKIVRKTLETQKKALQDLANKT